MSRVVQIVDMLRDWRQPSGPSLPARVRKLIDAQESESECLIGWVQLLLVGLFAILFLVAPRPTDAPMGFILSEPVPMALAVYFSFTVARLRLAYLGPLPGSVLLASILADVALLIGLIWSFHGQYGQEAAFSLKVPTFVYLFVFISVRVLRYDARFVIVAGLAAAIGWVGLVVVVLQASEPGVVTRSFAEHINHSRVLFGAEVDKVATLLLVTGVLALAVRRSRQLFVAAIRDQAAMAELKQFFGQGVPDSVTSAEAEVIAGQAQAREAAILMLDIRGFTGLSTRLAPRVVVDVITSLHAKVIPIVRRHNGIVDKFMGDGVMVTFGAVTPSNRAAADALSALDDVMAVAEDWQDEICGLHGGDRLAVNGAVASGSVVFAVVGAEDRLEYTVIGEAVNLAAKLEKHNKSAGSKGLTTVATYTEALEQGYRPQRECARRRGDRVAGTEKPLDLVVLG